MASFEIRYDVAAAMTRAAEVYAREHRVPTPEMGCALFLAAAALMSTRLTDVQLDEVYEQIKALTADIRKPNAS